MIRVIIDLNAVKSKGEPPLAIVIAATTFQIPKISRDPSNARRGSKSMFSPGRYTKLGMRRSAGGLVVPVGAHDLEHKIGHALTHAPKLGQQAKD